MSYKFLFSILTVISLIGDLLSLLQDILISLVRVKAKILYQRDSET